MTEDENATRDMERKRWEGVRGRRYGMRGPTGAQARNCTQEQADASFWDITLAACERCSYSRCIQLPPGSCLRRTIVPY